MSDRWSRAWLRKFWHSLRDTWNWRVLLVSFAGSLPASAFANGAIRPRLLRWAGIEIGQGFSIGPGFDIVTGSLVIGDYVYCNNGCRFDAGGGIRIGSACQIGPRVSFETSTHQAPPVPHGHRPVVRKSICVEDNVWIGANAVILPGITIHEGAVVAAGAVVTEDVPTMTIVGGVPARVIGRSDPT